MASCLPNDYYQWISPKSFVQIKYLLILIFVFKCFICLSNSTKINDNLGENSSYLKNSRNLFTKIQNNDYLTSVLASIQNTSQPFDPLKAERFLEQIYGKIANDESTRNEQLSQISSWLSGDDSTRGFNHSSYLKDAVNKYMRNLKDDQMDGDLATAEALRAERFKNQHSMQSQQQSSTNSKPIDSQSTHSQKGDQKSEEEVKDDSSTHNMDNSDEDVGPSGTTKAPPCAHYGRYYCSYKEDYPIKVVTEVTKYYKWPLEKLFRDLKQQVMPTLANDNSGGLVCDSITRIIRPGWSKNTNGRWLVVINTDHYQQYVTEVICRHGTGSYCNFIPPCYHSSCRQRYNTQKLLVVDPWNPYKGPFLSEFLFPSCCVCYIPGDNEVTHSPNKMASNQPQPQPNLYSSAPPIITAETTS